ncbi:unnamed protein product [Ectocarpus fasciculatus]
MASTGGEEKDGDSEGGAGVGVGGGGKVGGAMLREGSSGAKPKNVAWEDAEREVGEKQEQEADAIELSTVTDGRLVSPSIGSLPAAYMGEEKQEEEEEERGEAAPQANGGAASAAAATAAAAAAAEKEGTPAGDAVPVDEDGLDKALQEPSVPSRDESGGNNLPPELKLEDVTAVLADDKGRSAAEPENQEDEEERVRTPCRAYGESMAAKARRIRKQSLEGARAGWKLQRLIMKSNDDVRQEVFIMQLIIFYKEVFEREGLDLWLKPYSILSTAKTTGLIEVLNQATSLDGLKKSDGYPGSLVEHFYAVFGPKDSEGFKAAQRRFACSLAGYSVVSYLLRIKDRHNGNVMLDSDGHIVHIDFGFVLGSAPGNKFSMERAAFKFTSEYLEVLGGKDSPMYEEFIEMFCKGLAAARKYATVTITMLEIMMFQSEFPCFEYMGEAALTMFKKRLMLGAKDSDVARRARRMVNKANAHVGTRLYDQFQLCTNGILP